MKHLSRFALYAVFAGAAVLVSAESSVSHEKGWRLSQIEKGSVWEKLGLKNEDEILEINGKKLKGVEDFAIWAKNLETEKKVTVKILRAGKVEILHYVIK